jgi:hypothetical protein
MAKRFTDTDKWKDAWFTELDPAMKCFWLYLCDTCDAAGVWKVNFGLASYSVGAILDKQSTLKALGDRITEISTEKWFIEKFIRFQYPRGLSDSCKAHQGILTLLKGHNIELKSNISDPIQYPISMGTVLSTVQDKDKDKDICSSSFSSLNTKEGISPDSLIELFNATLADKGRLGHCRGLSGKQLQDLITTLGFAEFQKIETWRELFGKVAGSDFLLGKKGTFAATLNWLVVHDNALKVLNGQYNGAPDDQKPGKVKFKSAGHGVAPSEENPTGNPYIQEAIDRGLVS